VISSTGCEVVLAQEHLRFLILDANRFLFNIGWGRRDALRRVRELAGASGYAATTERGPPGIDLRSICAGASSMARFQVR
jgi:hypothetical protein